MTQQVASSAACVVCERGNTWTVHLKQMLRDAGIVVRQTGRLGACWQDLECYPASFLLLETDNGNLRQVFDLLPHIRSRFPDVRVAVALSRGLEEEGWSLREAGAIHAVESTRQLDSITRIVRRHVARAPAIDMTWAARVAARLPWK